MDARPGQPHRRPHRLHGRPRAAHGDRPRHRDHRRPGRHWVDARIGPVDGRGRGPPRPSPTRPRSSRPGPATSPGWWPRSVPTTAWSAWSQSTLPVAAACRRRPRWRSRSPSPSGRRPTRWPWPRRASGPSTGPSGCRAGSWTSSRRSPASRDRCSASTATRSTVDAGAAPGRRRDRGRRLRSSAGSWRLGLRRAARRVRGGRGVDRPACATLADVEAIDDPVLRRRARHVVTENMRVEPWPGPRPRRLAYAGER